MLQIVTGIFLAMHYTCDVELAFESVVYIMTDVDYGWLIRFMHSNGASMIFILMYIHIARSLFYRLYSWNHRYMWWSGLMILFLMIITAFLGYVLPWGQMSYWGATVITNLVTAVPYVGEIIVSWLWGGFAISNATLSRFYSLHYCLPFIILALIGCHLGLLHLSGSSSPTQVSPFDTEICSFHPYYTYKDLYSLCVTLVVFFIFVFYFPNYLGHPDNYIEADPMTTPLHIVPEWYFTPYYAVLRACPSKLGGVIGMLGSILILFILPFYPEDNRKFPSQSSPIFQLTFWYFVFTFLFLMFLGNQAAVEPYVTCSEIASLIYFMYFLFFIPLINILDSLEWDMEWRVFKKLFKNKKKSPTFILLQNQRV